MLWARQGFWEDRGAVWGVRGGEGEKRVGTGQLSTPQPRPWPYSAPYPTPPKPLTLQSLEGQRSGKNKMWGKTKRTFQVLKEALKKG